MGAWGSFPLSRAVPKRGGVCPPSLPTDKCITSELLKDIPLPGVLGGTLSAEAELLKGGESWVRGQGGSCFFLPPPPSRTLSHCPPSLQARSPPQRNLSMGTSKPSRSIARRRMGAK